MVHLLERYRTVAAPVTSHMLAPSAPFMACPLALLHADAHSGPIRTAVPRVDACPQTSRLDLLLESRIPQCSLLSCQPVRHQGMSCKWHDPGLSKAERIGSRVWILIVITSLCEIAYKRFKSLISHNVLQSDIEVIEDPDPQARKSLTLLDNMSRSLRLHTTL